MPRFIIRYSGPGTHVLRTEAMVEDDVAAVLAHAKRRLAASRTFCAADICDEERLAFRVTAGRDGVLVQEAEAAAAKVEESRP